MEINMVFDAQSTMLTDIYNEVKHHNNVDFKDKHLKFYKKAHVTHSIFVNRANPFRDSKEIFNDIFEVSINQLKQDDNVKICLNYDDYIESYKTNKLGIFIGIEGANFIDDISQLEDLYEQGVRHISITWNETNKFGSGVYNDSLGLTEKGKELIKKIEELGMILDLSHANYLTFMDILKIVKKPIIVSHGNCCSICNDVRNYTDEQLRMIKDKDGVIGISSEPLCLSHKAEDQNVRQIAKHINHAVTVVGINHVGLGLNISYYLKKDTYNTGIKGFENISKIRNLTKELRNIGYSKSAIEKIYYKNFERIIKQVL